MKPSGAPELPMGARKRKGLIGTEVRGEKMRGPGARCVVQFLEKTGTFKRPKFTRNDYDSTINCTGRLQITLGGHKSASMERKHTPVRFQVALSS